MKSYVIFFKGINVGGNKKIPMVELKKLLTGSKFQDVITILNSGNVILKANNSSKFTVKTIIEQLIQEFFGFESKVIAMNAESFLKMYNASGIKANKASGSVKQYVTFVNKKITTQVKDMLLTFDKDKLDILHITDFEVYWNLDTTSNKTVDVMKILEKNLSKDITTRNWNTVERIVKGLGG